VFVKSVSNGGLSHCHARKHQLLAAQCSENLGNSKFTLAAGGLQPLRFEPSPISCLHLEPSRLSHKSATIMAYPFQPRSSLLPRGLPTGHTPPSAQIPISSSGRNSSGSSGRSMPAARLFGNPASLMPHSSPPPKDEPSFEEYCESTIAALETIRDEQEDKGENYIQEQPRKWLGQTRKRLSSSSYRIALIRHSHRVGAGKVFPPLPFAVIFSAWSLK
jgi:hypothetical protein